MSRSTDPKGNHGSEVGSHKSSTRTQIQLFLRKKREQQGMSLRELSERSGIPTSSLHSLERDNRSELSLLRIVPLARALNLSIDELVGLSHDQPSRSLSDFMESDQTLTSQDLAILKSITWPPGKEPHSKERWRFILNSLQTSAALDVGKDPIHLDLSLRPRKMILVEDSWIRINGLSRTFAKLNLTIDELNPVATKDDRIAVNRQQMFNVSNELTDRKNGQSALFLLSLLWSIGPSRNTEGRMTSGRNPFLDPKGLASGLNKAFEVFEDQGPVNALAQLLKIDGVGVLRACPLIYIWSHGVAVHGETAVPFRPPSERLLVKSNLIPGKSSNRVSKIARYGNYLGAIQKLAEEHKTVPDVVEDALFRFEI